MSCCALAGCNSVALDEQAPSASPEPEVSSTEEAVEIAEPTTAEELADVERERTKSRCRESANEGELSVRWETAPADAQTQARAIIRNNGTTSVTAEPVLIAASASLGERKERELSPVSVAPGAEVVLPVNVADFPVQTVGEATSVSIGLRWTRSDVPQAAMKSPQALSQELYATHDDMTFRSAVLRDGQQEMLRQAAGKATRLIGARAFDRAGVMKLRTAAELKGPASALAVSTSRGGQQ